ncbi:MAG TPA: hypothetical protein PKN24_15980 [bacterium]|jgi:hypothetical protein|nr:hypothetical protein [bacterium]
MDRLTRFINSIIANGTAATVKEYSGGTQCPCMISRGTEAPAYSADWHRRNPSATNCNGTGLIGSTTSTVSIKTMVIDAKAVGDEVDRSGKWTEIGKLEADDVALYGAVKVSDGSNYSFADLTDKNEITVLGNTYAVKYTLKIPIDGTVVTAALCRRLS